MTHAQPKEIILPKRPPRWRELTDEQRWSRIYADREKRREQVIRSLQEAVALALPAFAMHMAICDCHKTDTAVIRYDAHRAVVGAVALVSSRLVEAEREAMVQKLQRQYELLKTAGFFTDNREFLYAVSAAVVRLADAFFYPPDSPVTLAAILFKEDAEADDNEWALSKDHALRMSSKVYDTLLAMEFYAQPMG